MSKIQENKETTSQNSAEKTVKNTVKKNKSNKPSFTERFRNFKEYLLLSRLELRKVSWPTMKETKTTSYVVLGFITVMAILLGLVDLLLSSLVALILS